MSKTILPMFSCGSFMISGLTFKSVIHFEFLFIFVIFQSLKCVWHFETLWTAAPGFFVFHYLLEFAQTHVHWVGYAIQPSDPLGPLLLLPSVCPSIRVFSNELVFASGGQIIEKKKKASISPFQLTLANRYYQPLGYRKDCPIRGSDQLLLHSFYLVYNSGKCNFV